MIKVDFPPNIEQLVEVFPHVAAAYETSGLPDGHPDKADQKILFAYAEDIYNPAGISIPHALLVHEYRHCGRQFYMGVEAWWTQYIADDEFRYSEELLGHVEEYRAQAALLSDRNARAKLSMRTANRLIAPLYNYTPPRTLKQAMRDLEALV